MIRNIIKYACILIVVCAGCYADMQTKEWAETKLKNKPPVTIIKHCMDLGFVENHGMVFGMLNNGKASTVQTILLGIRIALLVGVSTFIIMSYRRSFFFLLPFLFLWAGAWGNVFDSVKNGHVIDFIHIYIGGIFDWPFFFNLADVYICVGATILLIKTILEPATASIAETRAQ